MEVNRWVLLALLSGLVACGSPSEVVAVTEVAAPVANAPEAISGTWHLQEVAAPFPAGATVPPPIQEAVQRLRTRLAGTELAFANGIVKLHQPGRAPVVGPVTYRADGPGSGVLILPPAIEAVLASGRSGREQRFEQVDDRLRLPRPEGILVFAR